MKRNFTSCVFAAVLGFGLLLAGSGRAQVTSIWNTTSGNFSNTANWDITQVPVNGDAAFFDTNDTYQVDLTRDETNSLGRVTAGNVTFNMNGWSYLENGTLSVTSVNYGVVSFPITNSAVTVTGGGTLEVRSGAYFSYNFDIAAGGSLTVTGGSTVVAIGGGHQGLRLSGGSLVVDGAGSQFLESGGPYGPGMNGNITVQNGGLFRATDAISIGLGRYSVVVQDPSSKIYASALQTSYGGAMDLVVTNGAELWIPGGYLCVGNYDSAAQTIGIGGPGAASMLVSSNLLNLGDGGWDYWGGWAVVTIKTNGTMRVVGSAGSVWLGDGSGGSILSLEPGSLVQMGTGTVIDVQSDNHIVDGNIPTLRGVGTIAKYDAGANFSIVNSGVIRPGDISATPAMGTLSIVGGDLYQTNATGQIYFEFSDVALDQISISGSQVSITTGTNWFSLAAGSPVPTPGVKWGLGAYDFIVAANISYSPQYDNLTNLLASYGLTENLDYRWGVMNIGGGLQALRLEFVPEPSTVLLLLGGGLVLWQWKRRRG